MVATNNDALHNLVNPGGPVDTNFMASAEALMGLAARSYESWDLRKHGGLTADLAQRGVDQSSAVKRFPYREYGLPIYRAIQKFVTSYLSLWYPAAGFQPDAALVAWNQSLSQDYKVGSHALPLPQHNVTLDDLITACTNIIWTCGPQHAAVNYTQFPFLADAHTVPFANYITPQGTIDVVPRDRIADQAAVIIRLAAFRWDQLGHYADEAGPSDIPNGISI